MRDLNKVEPPAGTARRAPEDHQHGGKASMDGAVMKRRVFVAGVATAGGLVGLGLAYAIADPRVVDNANVYVPVVFGLVPAFGAGLLAYGFSTNGNTVALGAGVIAGFGGLLVASLEVRSLTSDLLFVAVPAVVARVVVARLMRKRF